MTLQTSRRGVMMASIGGFVAGRGVVTPGVAAAATPEAGEDYAPEIDPGDFSRTIDNRYFPLTPGAVFHYAGESDGEQQTETVTVLNETREVMGVTCVVVRDQVLIEDEVVEDTLDWYAQDSAGNVWYFGEESKDYEDGEVVSTAGSWEAGVGGAQPGIVMLGDPKVGDTYRQEYYAGEAEDMGEVFALGETVSVPAGDFTDVLVTRDTNPLEPEIVEHKYFAPGVGLIFEELVEGGDERMELVEIEGAGEDDGSPEADDVGGSPEADDGEESDDYDY